MGNDVTVALPMSYNGPGATTQRMAEWDRIIEDKWSGRFGRDNVKTYVARGRYRGQGNLITIPLSGNRALTGGIGGTSGNLACEFQLHHNRPRSWPLDGPRRQIL